MSDKDAPRPKNQSARFLIVDDFQMVRIDLKTKLESIGYTSVDEAADGAEALNLIKQSVQSGTPYEVIFCDWNMPKKSGLDVLQEIRKDPDTVAIPFIMITSETDSAHVIRALQAGASDYVVKPVSIGTLSSKLNKFL